MNKKTHYEVVLDYLEKHPKGLSSMEAFERFGITRISATIYNLRHDGYNISVENKTVTNRYGRKVTFAIYKLEK